MSAQTIEKRLEKIRKILLQQHNWNPINYDTRNLFLFYNLPQHFFHLYGRRRTDTIDVNSNRGLKTFDHTTTPDEIAQYIVINYYGSHRRPPSSSQQSQSAVATPERLISKSQSAVVAIPPPTLSAQLVENPKIQQAIAKYNGHGQRLPLPIRTWEISRIIRDLLEANPDLKQTYKKDFQNIQKYLRRK